ncbi:BatD family protein [Polaribacter vadi]|uniref:BatD family protein n=1 Tax=Polaribacter TaxID=52959 RepID=UPI001C09C7F6|nr:MULTISPECIES: BatD family protein [Polaribacter]MBU3011588.1 BatD family protein [Polaribacter vadi]MDO6741401.1 BatD family protein [Polaribacter sp. 1_MG-2023]
MRKYILHIFLLISAVAFAQDPIVKAQIETSNIRIGEQFNLRITVKDVDNVILPKLQLKGLEVIDSAKVDTLNYMLIQKYVLTGFDSGAFYIPQQQVFVRNQAYLTDSLLVNVATVAVDTTVVKKYPIKSIKKEPLVFDDYKLYIYLLIAALLIIGFWIYWFVIRKRKVEEEDPTYVALAPYEEAMYKLNELDEKLLWQNNQVKQYYSELTDIIRGYIERELKVPALEKTSDEIIEVLNDFHDADTINTTKENIKKLKELFKEADLVKFAKSKPMALEIEEDRKDAEEVVHNLKPKPISKDEELE